MITIKQFCSKLSLVLFQKSVLESAFLYFKRSFLKIVLRILLIELNPTQNRESCHV